MFVAARVANINVIAILVDSKGNFISKEIIVTLITEQVIVRKTTRANKGAVMYHSHLAFFVIFFAVLAEAIVLVKAVFADLYTFAVTVEDIPSFGGIIFALLTQFATVMVVAIVAEELSVNFSGARNAKSICSDLENLEVVLMILSDRNFSVKVRVRPGRVTAKTITASDVNAVFITTIFFGLPEVRNAFKGGKFTLN